MRIIMHIDMDAFFTAVEERKNPHLRGKPVVVGADPKGGAGRGVVSTANYEARKFGIRSGMPISIAYRKCPQAVFLPVNMRLYAAVSQGIMQIARSYADKFEQAGIDEAYLDVSQRAKNFDEATELAKKLKQEIMEKEKLACSVGIGPNKLVAKIASDYQKPDGLTVVKPEQMAGFLSPLSVRKLHGVGPKTEAALRERVIGTVRQLSAVPLFALKEWFGEKFGTYLYYASRGVDESEVVEEWKVKSIGREHTFEQDTGDRTEILGALARMARQVVREAGEQGFKTITVKVRFQGFETHTSQKTLKEATNSNEVALEVAKELLEPYLQSRRKLRLVGFRVSKLEEKV